MQLAQKAAIVTGAGSGIGRGIALALAKSGVSVIIADIEEAKAQAVAQEVAALGVRSGHFRLDVRDPAQVKALADHSWATLGRIDILCNNAGVVVPGPALEISDADFRWQSEVNVIGVLNGMRECAPRFIAQGGPAWIVNTGSHQAIGVPSIGVAAYIATKHAVLGLTDAFRKELGAHIGFSLLCPGIINTSIWDAGRNRPSEFGGSFAGDPRNQAALLSRGMRPERVGDLVARGIEAEEFYIWTHPQDLELIESRYQEAKQSLLRQWPNGPDAEQQATPHDVS